MNDEDRNLVRNLAKDHLDRNDPAGWFEPLYAAAKGEPDRIPWADMAPNPNLLQWLDDHRIEGKGKRALVVGCGLGDDAGELARRGFDVTAFDISPTAINWCKKRFAHTTVQYRVADAMHPPADWSRAFDFVLESYTLQALPPAPREIAKKAVFGLVAPGGSLLVICRGRDVADPPGDLPWPLTREELEQQRQAEGLVERSFEDYLDRSEDPPVRRFRALFVRNA